MARLIAKYEPKPQEWYEDPPVVYGFNIPQVTDRLEWLMGSNTVHALDLGYNKMLLKMIEEDVANKVNQRNINRKREEISREKRLVLEGKMAIDEAPKEILRNAVLRIYAKIEEIQREKKQKEIKLLPPAYYYDYTLVKAFLKHRGKCLAGYGETKCETDLSYYRLEEYKKKTDDSYELPPKMYARFRPQERNIQNLYYKSVKEMYKRADIILGYTEKEQQDESSEQEEEEEEEEGDRENVDEIEKKEIPIDSKAKQKRKSMNKKIIK